MSLHPHNPVSNIKPAQARSQSAVDPMDSPEPDEDIVYLGNSHTTCLLSRTATRQANDVTVSYQRTNCQNSPQSDDDHGFTDAAMLDVGSEAEPDRAYTETMTVPSDDSDDDPIIAVHPPAVTSVKLPALTARVERMMRATLAYHPLPARRRCPTDVDTAPIETEKYVPDGRMKFLSADGTAREWTMGEDGQERCWDRLRLDGVTYSVRPLVAPI
jgi:hypothetical protein